MKGRASDWSAQLAGQPLSYVLAAATAAGFDGLWVDPAGFEPAKAAAIRTTLAALLSQAPLVSPLGDLWFFDLRPYRALLRRTEPPALVQLLRERTLRPLRTTCSAAGVALENPTGGARAATLTLHVARTGHTYDATHSGAPDGQAEDYPGSTAITISRRLLLAPGTTRIARIAGAGSAPQLLYATLTEDSLLRFARLGSARAQTLVPGLSRTALRGVLATVSTLSAPPRSLARPSAGARAAILRRAGLPHAGSRGDRLAVAARPDAHEPADRRDRRAASELPDPGLGVRPRLLPRLDGGTVARSVAGPHGRRRYACSGWSAR